MSVFFVLSVLLGMGRYAVDGTFHFPEVQQMDTRHDALMQPTGPIANTDGGHEVGDALNFWAIDESGSFPLFYLTSATCRFVGERAYIFVEDTQWNTNFDQEAVDSLAAALDAEDGITATDAEYFGEIPDLIDDDPRVYYLILNIRDGYGVNGQRWYIAGYFSPYNMFTEWEARNYYGGHSNEVEMLYIDCYPARMEDATYTASHELVHLIQYGIKPFSGEELWVLENQAQLGTFLCGYPAAQVETFVDYGGVTPIKWTDFTDGERIVAGYGAGYLFFSYLFENYGGKDFIWNNMHGTVKGIQGVIDAIESATGRAADMERILSDWMLSCFIDDPSVGYGWEGLSIASYDTLDPGNRPGLDYTGVVQETPYHDPWHGVSGYQGNYYSIADGLVGSLRAEGSGIGDLEACFFDGSSVVRLDTGSANDVAVDLNRSGALILLCNSFSGLDVNISAGSTAGDGLAVFPNPCLGDLYFQFVSTGEPVQLSIFSQTADCVDTVTLSAPSGETVVTYSGASDLSSGIYFYRFQQGSRTETGRVAVVR